jgi:hypothetical protein
MAVFGIRDILVRIRIRGSIPLTNGSRSRFFCLLLFEPIFTSFFKDKKSERTGGMKVFLNIFAWWLKDSEPDLSRLADKYPDPGCPKTYVSYGSGSPTLLYSVYNIHMSSRWTDFCLFGNAYKLQIQNLGVPYHEGKAGGGGASHVYHLLPGSLCRTILSFSRCQLCFFPRLIIVYVFSLLWEYEVAKKHKRLSHSCRRKLFVRTTYHLWTELYELEKIKSVPSSIRCGAPYDSCRTWKLLQRVGLDWYWIPRIFCTK